MKVAVRYHEIALKGKNRPFFVERLSENLKRATSDLGVQRVAPLHGRILVELAEGVPWDQVRQRVATVLGVANFSPVHECAPDLQALQRGVAQALVGSSFGSFRVTTKRSYKGFPRTSMEIDRELGGVLKAATAMKVDLESPEVTVFVEVLKDRMLYSLEKHPGPGGFPAGSSGRVAALLSGGIDSPVAAYRMMKRGCRVVFVHFHAFPLQDRATIDKARELARILTRYQFRSRLLLVPFAAAQQAIVASCPAPLRVVLYRRFMVRIAEALASRQGAKALVTGESLGQVASQTLDNIAAIDQAACGPILRPLVGMDKQEIAGEARRIGTFEVSILPDQDCCQLYVPRSPATAATVAAVTAAEAALPASELVAAALGSVEEERFEFP